MLKSACRTIILASLPFLHTALTQAQVPGFARDGGSRETLQSISVSPKQAAPFSATVVTEWTRLLEDGTTTTIKNHRTIARDSTGRIFQERRSFSLNGDKQETILRVLEYADPNRHEFYSCMVNTGVCMLSTYRTPPPIAAELPPSVTLPNGAGSITRESLGTKLISNLEVQGARQVTTINPGPNGYKQPEPTIKEIWYSPHLDLNLIVKRFEPRGGAENFTVENINLTEPDPKLFVPPEKFKIVRLDPQ